MSIVENCVMSELYELRRLVSSTKSYRQKQQLLQSIARIEQKNQESIADYFPVSKQLPPLARSHSKRNNNPMLQCVPENNEVEIKIIPPPSRCVSPGMPLLVEESLLDTLSFEQLSYTLIASIVTSCPSDSDPMHMVLPQKAWISGGMVPLYVEIRFTKRVLLERVCIHSLYCEEVSVHYNDTLEEIFFQPPMDPQRHEIGIDQDEIIDLFRIHISSATHPFVIIFQIDFIGSLA